MNGTIFVPTARLDEDLRRTDAEIIRTVEFIKGARRHGTPAPTHDLEMSLKSHIDTLNLLIGELNAVTS